MSISKTGKTILKHFGRTVLFFFFLIVLLLPPAALGILWEQLQSPAFFYEFFGKPTPVKTILIAGTIILTPFALSGIIGLIKAAIKEIKHKKGKLHNIVKFDAVFLLCFVVGTIIFYFPNFYLSMGVDPKFGPYLSLHGGGGVQISWDTRDEVNTELIWGTEPEELTNTAIGGEFFWQNGDETHRTNHHIVVLNNELVAGERYYYSVPAFNDKVHSFIAPPDPESSQKVTFTILGDAQGNAYIQELNIKRMVDKYGVNGIDFTINTGDFVNYDDFMMEWATFFDHKSYGKIIDRVPVMGPSGNHETYTLSSDSPRRGNYKTFFQNNFGNGMYPNGWNETTTNEVGCYYSFNYSNVHFAVLDNLENDSRVLSQEQLNWLDEDLARNKDNWKFLTFHLSMYSTSDHGPDPKMQEQLEPLMYKHKVNALFFGHDHIYESYHVNSTSTEYPGTYAFLCAGGGGSLKPVTSTPTMGERAWNGTTNEHGNFILEVQHSNNPAIHQLEGSEYQIYGERVHHYMSVELEGESATFRAYRTIDDSLIQEFVNVSRT